MSNCYDVKVTTTYRIGTGGVDNAITTARKVVAASGSNPDVLGALTNDTVELVGHEIVAVTKL